MILPIKGGRITGHFNDPSKSDPNRIHGALDVAPDNLRDIVAPVNGVVMGWIAHRQEPGTYWPELPHFYDLDFPFANYFYDMFGGVIILQRNNGETHIITHSYGRQLTERPAPFYNWRWIEEEKVTRWPIFGLYSSRTVVEKGEVIGRVGNAGFSTGAHVHWEVHPTSDWHSHVNRIDPEQHLETS